MARASAPVRFNFGYTEGYDRTGKMPVPLGGDFLGAFAAVDEEEDGHADGEAVGDLVQNQRALAIGDFAVDFYAAIDGAGVHDERVGFGFLEARFVEAKERGVFVDARKHRLALALVLDAQEMDDVGVTNRFFHVVGDAATHLLKHARHQSCRAAERDLGAEFRERPNIRARDTAVEDVAEDRDIQAFNFSLSLANGEGVQQGLRGMLVRAVAGIDDAGTEHAGKKMRRAGSAVADDDEVRIQCLEIQGGVFERLAFLERGGLGGKIDDVRGEPLLGQFEADARAGGGLDEEVDHRLAAQRGNFLDGALADGFEGAGGIEHRDDFFRCERFDVEQMFTGPGHGVG